MGDLIRFVDSIAASPTVRLDINDEVSWFVKSFSAPPPRLRRSVAQNAMRDGAFVGASSYDSRMVTLELELVRSTQDANATDLQKLFRELDRASNYLMYQPAGASKPVFFRLYRSDTSQLEDVIAQAAMRRFTVELMAEPFALGLRETLGPFTVNNDPAAASNGCYFDATGVIGDVAAPLVMWDDATTQVDRFIAATHTSAPVPLTYVQAESLTLGVDTTNPGGGPDAAMSGVGVNNFARTTFATTPTSAARLTWTVPDTTRGQHRVLVFVRSSVASGAFTIGLGAAGAALPDTTVAYAPVTGLGQRKVVDLGIRDFSQGVRPTVGYSGALVAKGTQQLSIFATRTSGTATLDWDVVMLIPAGGQNGEKAAPSTLLATGTTARLVVDGVQETVAGMSAAGDPIAGAGTFSTSGGATGSFPAVVPEAANRIFMVRTSFPTGDSQASLNLSVTAAYWPRYLFVRPAAS